MKKFSRREKTILRFMLLVVFVALSLNLYDRYALVKEALANEVESKRTQISTFMKELEGQNPERYKEGIARIEGQLLSAQEKVLELPQETDASLLIRQTISENAERTGLTINSISPRKSKEINEEKQLKELRTYFGYDTDLEAFLQFFESFNQQDYYLVIESLNISARRQPRTSSRNRRRLIRQRSPLNGNAVLATLYMPNENASLERYERPPTGYPEDPNPQPEEGEPEVEPIEGSQEDASLPAEPRDSDDAAAEGAAQEGAAKEVAAYDPEDQDSITEERIREVIGSPPKAGGKSSPTTMKPKPRPLTPTAKPGKKNKTKINF